MKKVGLVLLFGIFVLTGSVFAQTPTGSTEGQKKHAAREHRRREHREHREHKRHARREHHEAKSVPNN